MASINRQRKIVTILNNYFAEHGRPVISYIFSMVSNSMVDCEVHTLILFEVEGIKTLFRLNSFSLS